MHGAVFLRLWCIAHSCLCHLAVCSPQLLEENSAHDRFGGGARANGRAVEMMTSAPGQPFTSKWRSQAGNAGAAAGLANGSHIGGNRDQRQDAAGGSTAGGVGSTLDPPVNLPAIKTSAGGSSTAAAANGMSQQQGAAAKFSLGDDDDELHEIVLDSAKAPDKVADKKD